MKIYTKTGDAGDTGLFGGARVPKDDPRVEAYGAVDELNSQLGLVRAAGVGPDVDAALHRVQCELFEVGAELATAPGRGDKGGLPQVQDAAVERLEGAIDAAEAELEPLRSFVLPGGAPAAAHLHVARTTCRRAERRVVALGHRDPVRSEVARYLNRLSDLLFVWARLANRRRGVADVPWIGGAGRAS